MTTHSQSKYAAMYFDRLCIVNRNLQVDLDTNTWLHLNVVRFDPRAVRVVGPSDMLEKASVDFNGDEIDDVDHSFAFEILADVAVKEGGREAFGTVCHLVSCA